MKLLENKINSINSLEKSFFRCLRSCSLATKVGYYSIWNEKFVNIKLGAFVGNVTEDHGIAFHMATNCASAVLEKWTE